MTDTNWPNPHRLGAPLFHENYGKHTLIDKETGNEFNADWNNADAEWLLPNGWLSAKNAAKHFAYVGCVSVELTPTQISEMLAGERERCAQAAQKVSDEYYEKRDAADNDDDRVYADERMCAASECADDIRNLGAAS